MVGAVAALDAAGAVATVLPGFAPRAAQIAMAGAVERALEDDGVVVCEAGTGIGKTFAYLIPALLSGKRVLVSTGTKHLQDQIFEKDLPLVRAALNVDVPVTLLKGRANYLCRHRMETFHQRRRQERTGLTDSQLFRVQQWAARTATGDISEFSELAEDSSRWRAVTSTAENCQGAKCPDYEQCFVLKARQRALKAQVLIVNHHLFFADLALREEGFGELLPSVDAVIFDEAHLLPQIATQFFGYALSTRQIDVLLRDAVASCEEEAPDTPGLKELCFHVADQVAAVEAAIPAATGRTAWETLRDRAAIREAVGRLRGALESLTEGLLTTAERGPEIAAVQERAATASDRLFSLTEERETEAVRWVDRQARNLTWHCSPLDVAPAFAKHLAMAHRGWVFTSATLSVGGDCAHFANRLGLVDYESLSLPSPYDFAKHCLGYVPSGLPAPGHPDFHAAFAEAVEPVLHASGGRAFVLFTSFRGMHETFKRLEGRLSFPLLMQGQAPRSELLRQFRALDQPVLFGTSSFWQGVDVPGDALSCVIIDKLPFESPGDPLLAARLRFLEQNGENPFMDYQVPQAVLALKQGVGRLIRGEQDRGVVMIADGRLMDKPYGRIFARSLPPFPVARSFDAVSAFFSAMAQPPDPGEQKAPCGLALPPAALSGERPGFPE